MLESFYVALLEVGEDFGIFRGSPSSLLCCLFAFPLCRKVKRGKKETLQTETGGFEALLESKGEEASPGGRMEGNVEKSKRLWKFKFLVNTIGDRDREDLSNFTLLHQWQLSPGGGAATS